MTEKFSKGDLSYDQVKVGSENEEMVLNRIEYEMKSNKNVSAKPKNSMIEAFQL